LIPVAEANNGKRPRPTAFSAGIISPAFVQQLHKYYKEILCPMLTLNSKKARSATPETKETR